MKKLLLVTLCVAALSSCGTQSEEQTQQASNPASSAVNAASSEVISASQVATQTVKTPQNSVSYHSETPANSPSPVVHQNGGSGISPLTAAAIGYMLGSSNNNRSLPDAPVSGFNSGGTYHQSKHIEQTSVKQIQETKGLPQPVKRDMRTAYKRQEHKEVIPVPTNTQSVEKPTAKTVDVQLSKGNTPTVGQ